MTSLPVVIVAALASALAAAASSVLQHRSARAPQVESASAARLVAYLLRQPAWMLSVVLAGLGLCCTSLRSAAAS